MKPDWSTWSAEYEFHEFRRKGLGSSEAAIILGVSPWRTAHQLLLEKTGEVKPDFTGNFATERGKELEPKVRDAYNRMHGCNTQPEKMIYPHFMPFRANADGIDRDKGKLIEIKCPGKKDHETAQAGGVPEKYMPQCQWLMMVSGIRSMDYISFYYKTEEMVIVPIMMDFDMVNELQARGKMFWELVTQRVDFLKELR